MPAGNHLRVLKWLEDAIGAFRAAGTLVDDGIKLYLNIHESLFRPEVLPPGDADALLTIAAWWRQATTPAERRSWAVLDMHHYHAWDEACRGASTGPPDGNYTCGEVGATHKTLARCVEWAVRFRAAVGEKDALLASSEFSPSTHSLVRLSCGDLGKSSTPMLP